MWFTPENLDNAPAFFRNGFAATAHMRTNPPLSLEGATFSGPVITQEMVPAVGEDIMTPHGEANVTAVEAGRVHVRIKSNERSTDEVHYDYHWVALVDVKRIHVPLQVGDAVNTMRGSGHVLAVSDGRVQVQLTSGGTTWVDAMACSPGGGGDDDPAD